MPKHSIYRPMDEWLFENFFPEYSNNAYEIINKKIFNSKELSDNYNKICTSSNVNRENLFNHLFFYREKHIKRDQEVSKEEKNWW